MGMEVVASAVGSGKAKRVEHSQSNSVVLDHWMNVGEVRCLRQSCKKWMPSSRKLADIQSSIDSRNLSLSNGYYSSQVEFECSAVFFV